MKICGVAAEYNPFHTGHLHHLSEIRKTLGNDTAVVCAMSGNFVQRGDMACVDKYQRAEAAVRCGADLVVELPLAAALSSAEGFAKGAVGVLRAFRCNMMSFGAETPDTGLIIRAAEALNSIPKGAGLDDAKGLSYAARRQEELRRLDPEAAKLLDSPNDTLGVEYCRFMPPIKPLPIPRIGAGHAADTPKSGFASASWLRGEFAKKGLAACSGYLPVASFKLLAGAVKNGEAPVTLPDAVMLGILRRLLYEGRICTGSKGGFDERLRNAVFEASSFREAVELARAKNFPAARVRRELLRLVLDIGPETTVEPEYLRVLAIGKQGRVLIKRASLPVIVKPVSENKLGYRDELLRDAFADDLFMLAMPKEKARGGGSHYRKTPFFLG